MNTQIMNPKNRKLISTEDKNQKDENKIRDDKKENATERRPLPIIDSFSLVFPLINGLMVVITLTPGRLPKR